MPVSSTAATVLKVAHARRKKPYFVAVAQELIASMGKVVSVRDA
jgi:hypothetical protein